MLIMTKRYHPSLSCKDVVVKELNHFKDCHHTIVLGKYLLQARLSRKDPSNSFCQVIIFIIIYYVHQLIIIIIIIIILPTLHFSVKSLSILGKFPKIKKI